MRALAYTLVKSTSPKESGCQISGPCFIVSFFYIRNISTDASSIDFNLPSAGAAPFVTKLSHR
jgi:hypothetical protein